MRWPEKQLPMKELRNIVEMNSPVIGKMSTKTGELINLLPKAHLCISGSVRNC